jgi:hypothetical protein
MDEFIDLVAHEFHQAIQSVASPQAGTIGLGDSHIWELDFSRLNVAAA